MLRSGHLSPRENERRFLAAINAEGEDGWRYTSAEVDDQGNTLILLERASS